MLTQNKKLQNAGSAMEHCPRIPHTAAERVAPPPPKKRPIDTPDGGAEQATTQEDRRVATEDQHTSARDQQLTDIFALAAQCGPAARNM